MTLWSPAAVVGDPPHDGFARVGGVIHVHTTLSDGGGTPDEVVAAAKRAGLQFVVITDHNNVDAKRFEGYHDGVLVIVGAEISTTAGHVLALGIPDPVFRFSGDARDAFDDVRELGGFAVVAHPVSDRADFLWTGWDLPGPWGVEIVNGDSQWRAAGWPRLLRAAVSYPVDPRYALLSAMTRPKDALERWDLLLAQRDAAALGGADAHQRLPLGKRFAPRQPSYESVFSLLRSWVLLEAPLTGAADRDAAAIVEALRRGRSHVGLEALAPSGEVSFVARSGGRQWTMGDGVPLESAPRLFVSGRFPSGATTVLLRDGNAVAEAPGPLSHQAGAGVYRVEVRAPGWSVPWILSNAITVAPAATLIQRARAAAIPSPPPAPAPRTVIASFDDGSPFAPQFDPSSAMPGSAWDPGGGRAGTGAARLGFRLGHATREKPFVWCALVSAKDRDLGDAQGITFWMRADGVYRVWFQVRDSNPASRDEGLEHWFTSVKAHGAEWERVDIPFSRLRSLNPRTDGRLDRDKVRQLVFVLDQGAVKEGAAGTIWIDDLALY